MAIVRCRGPYDSSGNTSFNARDGWEHVAVIYKDKSGEYKVLELRPSTDLNPY